MENRARFVALIGPVTGMLMAAAWYTPAMADTAMQSYELDIKRCSPDMPLADGTTECDVSPFYVDCLGEYLVGEYHVVGNYQEFATPSGMLHIRDNWKVVSMLFGAVTGRAWYAVGVSPASGNIGGIETLSASGTLTYNPLADGPTWQEQFVYTTIQNANGDIVRDMENYRAKCLGTDR